MNILIAGGSGMIGKNVTDLLLSSGHRVTWLSRSPFESKRVSCLTWAELPTSNYMPDVIINLAGHNLDCRWTKANRSKILNSRIVSTRRLTELIISGKWKPQLYIGSSAIGIYGNDHSPKTEQSPNGSGFLSDVVVQWENSSVEIESTTCRRVMLRLPAVLSNKGGMLAKLKTPTKIFGGVIIGNGKQKTAFIHIDDVSRLIEFVFENSEIKGVYNAAAPEIPDYKEFTRVYAKSLGKKVLLPCTPTWPLKVFLGERAGLVLSSQNIDSSKLIKTGFKFKYSNIRQAIEQLSTHANS